MRSSGTISLISTGNVVRGILTEFLIDYSGMPWYWQIVQLCPLTPNAAADKAMMCGGWGYTMQQQSPYTETTNQPGDQSFTLDVAYYLRKTLVFRVPTVQPQEVIIWSLINTDETVIANFLYWHWKALCIN